MAMTDKYVSPSGSASWASAGSLGTPCSFATMLANATAGTRVHYAAGTYSFTADQTFPAGTATSPVHHIGDTTVAVVAGVISTPTVIFSNGTDYAFIGGNYNVFEGIQFQGNTQYTNLFVPGTHTHGLRCRFINNNTAGAGATRIASANCVFTECHFRGNYASAPAINGIVGFRLNSCTVNNPNGQGIVINDLTVLDRVIVYGCGTNGISILDQYASQNLINCTIVNNGGDAINVDSAVTVPLYLPGCHITDNGGYGVNNNGTNIVIHAPFCRFRDNAAGNVRNSADWFSSTQLGIVTTDTGAQATDYTNHASNDFTLIQTAPGFQANSGSLTNIGACGSVSASGGMKAWGSS